MISKRFQTGRRWFLRGMGAAVALPLFESLLRGEARADDPTPPKRLLYYYVPNGFDVASFKPSTTGTDYALTQILAPLADHKQDMLVLTGLDNAPGNYQPGDVLAGAHFQQTAAFLTCKHVDGINYGAGKSIDQVAADAIGYVTPHRSLQLAVAAAGETGNCGNWPCAYHSHISWADATTPLARENNPITLFEQLFAPGVLGGSEEEFNKRKGYRLKVLDVVHEDAMALQSKLGTSDKQRLDQYLTSLNETENKINALQFQLACEPGDAPQTPQNYLQTLDAMIHVMALAFQCDSTRIITFMTYSGGASHGAAYNWVNYMGSPIQETFHDLSHHGEIPEKLGKVAAINTWEVSVFASLLDKLKAMPDVDGTSVLDNSMCFFSSECADGNSHLASDMPIVVAGSGGGAIQTGRHLAFQSPNNVYAELHIALLNAFGVPIQSFGDGNGPLPILV